jgi:hypothetical protein
MKTITFLIAALLSIGSLTAYADNDKADLQNFNDLEMMGSEQDQALDPAYQYDLDMAREHRWVCYYRSPRGHFSGVDRDRDDARRKARQDCFAATRNDRRCDFDRCQRIRD